MVEQFTFWLEKLFEDNPLPDEIDNILFDVKFAGKYKYIELRGYEGTPSENANCFRPLEAQFFHCNNLAKMEDKLFINRLKYLIEECFANKSLSLHLKGRKIFLKYANKLEYLFNV